MERRAWISKFSGYVWSHTFVIHRHAQSAPPKKAKKKRKKEADTSCKLSWKEWVFFVLCFNQSQILFNYCPVCLKADRRNLWKPSCKAWLFIDVNWLRKWSNPKERTESIAILCQSVMSSLGEKRKHLSSLPCCRLNTGVKSKAIFKSFFVQGFFPPHFYFFYLFEPNDLGNLIVLLQSIQTLITLFI